MKLQPTDFKLKQEFSYNIFNDKDDDDDEDDEFIKMFKLNFDVNNQKEISNNQSTDKKTEENNTNQNYKSNDKNKRNNSFIILKNEEKLKKNLVIKLESSNENKIEDKNDLFIYGKNKKYFFY